MLRQKRRYCCSQALNLTVADAIFRTKEQRIKTGSQSYLTMVSPARFDAFLRATLMIFAAASLLIPVLIPFELQPENQSQVRSRSKYQVLIIFLFTLAASAFCSFFITVRKKEVFTATLHTVLCLSCSWAILRR